MSSQQIEAAEISSRCVDFVADMLGRPPAQIDPAVKFSRLGLDSAMSVQLVVAIESWLGVQLSPDVIANHPTIESLTAYLCALRDKASRELRS